MSDETIRKKDGVVLFDMRPQMEELEAMLWRCSRLLGGGDPGMLSGNSDMDVVVGCVLESQAEQVQCWRKLMEQMFDRLLAERENAKA